MKHVGARQVLIKDFPFGDFSGDRHKIFPKVSAGLPSHPAFSPRKRFSFSHRSHLKPQIHWRSIASLEIHQYLCALRIFLCRRLNGNTTENVILSGACVGLCHQTTIGRGWADLSVNVSEVTRTITLFSLSFDRKKVFLGKSLSGILPV